MKTVIDAVNELRGCWSDNNHMEFVTFRLTWFYSDYDIFGFNSVTRQAFNECVKELSEAKWMNKPVYTKEFMVRGGTNCDPVWQPCEILFSGKKYTVVRSKEGREFSRRTVKLNIRDIDIRTDKENIFNDMYKFISNVAKYQALDDRSLNEYLHNSSISIKKLLARATGV